MAKLSIITINYKNLDGLRKTIESVISQTWTDFEYIVVDGLSNDGTKELLAQYEGLFAEKEICFKWVSEEDEGIYNAMNKGVAMSGGEYCNFMNSGDCFIDCHVLARIFENPLCSYDSFDIFIGKAKTETRIIFPPQVPSLSYFYYHLPINHQAAFIKRLLLVDCPYDEDKGLIVADWKFFLQALLIKKCAYLPIDEFVVFFDSHGIGSQNIKENRKQQDLIMHQYFNERMMYDLKDLRYDSYALVRLSKYIVSRLLYLKKIFSLKTYDNNMRLQKKTTKFLLFRRMVRQFMQFIEIYFSVGRTVNELGINREHRKVPVVVSLTSYPARMATLHKTLCSLLTQNFKPDKIILWLTSSQFPNREADIPSNILSLCKYGLTIEWCEENIKSYTKLVPSLKKYPDAILVVADDDILYRKTWLCGLYESYKQNPNVIHTYCSHRIEIVNGMIKPYNQWRELRKPDCSIKNLLMGVGGVLFPPKVLYSDVLDSNLFMSLSPNADDLWFWAMAVMNGIPVNVVCNKNSKTIPVFGVNDQDALFLHNSNGGNDVQMSNILNYYPVLKRKLFL